ncbi:glycosyltransferase [Acaryochloris sp. IP29b_bin.148]|uniref:glycosyltransferase n=1 Tax=Acaryochloris sp. IP29b_bin.148 TaxID=2969218 RepID=UPI0026052812|nr:glycosyltransferase [Acaryochloris sp. IP29b_bin.148]
MKVAIITSGFLPVIDGVTVSGLHRLQKLSDWGHQVKLFCPDYSALASVYPNWQDYTGHILPNVEVINLPSSAFMGLDFERNVNWRARKHLRDTLETFQPDLIHVDEPERLSVGLWQIPGIQYAQRAGIPCLGFFRTNFLEYAEDYFDWPPRAIAYLKHCFTLLLRRVYNAYDRTLVTSPITKNKIINLGINNVHYANLVGFDADTFSPHLRQANYFAHTYDLPQVDRQVKLVFVGRLTPDKGWGFTFKALQVLFNTVNPDQVAVLIAGDGSMRAEIGQQLSQLTPHVHLLGRVAPEQVPTLLANSDIHVTASEKEARGLTVLEAFASGIPVIAPRAGGVVENIVEGWNGYLYTPQSTEDFAHKLQQLIENPRLRQHMGERAQASLDQYSWDNTIQTLVSLWQDAIYQRQPAPLQPRRPLVTLAKPATDAQS